MPIPESPGGITSIPNDEGGRGMPSTDSGDSRSGSPGAAGGESRVPMDSGGRGAPSTGFGAPRGEVNAGGGAQRVPNRR